MPKYTRTEFAEECGVTSAYLRVYITRQKITEEKDGTIIVDRDHPDNELFYIKKTAELKKPVTAKSKEVKVVRLKKEKTNKAIEPQKSTISPGTQLVLDLERKTKQAEYERKLQEVELNKLKIAKLRGEAIPTDLVQVIFRQHFKSVTTSFHQGADGFISTVAQRAGLDKAELAALRGELIEIVNEAVKDAVADSKASIKNIVKEHSARRGVGESK